MTEATSEGGDPALAMLTLGGQTMVHGMFRRDQSPMIPVLHAYRAQFPEFATLTYTCATLLADAGDVEGAAAMLDAVAAKDFTDLPNHNSWGDAVWLLARANAAVGNARHAALLYELFEGYELRWVANRTYVCFGPAAIALGLLAGTAGRFADACRHFETALRLARAVPSPPWIAEACAQYAHTLVRNGAPIDDPRVTTLRAEASDLAARFDLVELAERVRALGEPPTSGQVNEKGGYSS